ncbi:MAG: 2-oxoacid:acceptor oxidoreductase family protein [Deltaproteobacteria bacterium]|nr:2-oxoacid:acceptor oxidoreductase family protein [Deltaproteobacteria bacterium]
MPFIDPATKPYPFCPGCSHSLVLDAIAKALEAVAADPRRTVLVSDIGCVGLADKHFAVHTFHGLHGRSFTYASGIKLARPDLLVLVLVGDGGCGIGGHHLINAARRNIGIKVLCCNNHNFGMTGGQHSVTTHCGAKTPTTPLGAVERPFDLAALVTAAGGTFVARAKAVEKGFEALIAQAFRHDGFAFVDLWEICTAHYMPANAYKKSALEARLAAGGLETGVLRCTAFPEYAQSLRIQPTAEAAVAAPQDLSIQWSHRLEAPTYGLVIAGSAGMKILSAAGRVARAAIRSGLWVSAQDDFPVTVQSGHALATLQFGREPLDAVGSQPPDAVLILSAEGLREVQEVLPQLAPTAWILAVEGLALPPSPAPVTRLALAGIDRLSWAMAAVAQWLQRRPIFPLEALRAELALLSDERVRAAQLRALECGAGTPVAEGATAT